MESLPPGYEDKPFFFTDEGAGRFYKQISAFADPNICGNAINDISRENGERGRIKENIELRGQEIYKNWAREDEHLLLSEKIELMRRRGEEIIAAMFERWAENTFSPLRAGINQMSTTEFAPFLARNLSRFNARDAGAIYPRIFEGEMDTYAAACLLFSGELTGGALDFLKGANYKSLSSMVNTFLGAAGRLPWWFSEESFMRSCIEFTDRPRNFSIPGEPALSRFLSIPAKLLKDNPGNNWVTELVAEFIFLCGRRAIQDTREITARATYQSPWVDQLTQDLNDLDEALGGRLTDLEREELSEEADLSYELGGVSF